MSTSGEEPETPVLRIVRGDPTAEEIAAVVTVLSAYAGTARQAQEPAPSAWTDRRTAVRRPLSPGPGAWRASGWNR